VFGLVLRLVLQLPHRLLHLRLAALALRVRRLELHLGLHRSLIALRLKFGAPELGRRSARLQARLLLFQLIDLLLKIRGELGSLLLLPLLGLRRDEWHHRGRSCRYRRRPRRGRVRRHQRHTSECALRRRLNY